MKMMTVATLAGYGGPEMVRLQQAPRPSPGQGEVLVRVRAAPVTAGDARMRSGKVPRGFGLLLRLAIGWSKPRNPPGWSYSGEVAGLGEGARGFSLGQRVFGITGIKGGAHRDDLVVKPAGGAILPMPESLSFEEGAAFFFGGLTAAEFLLDKAGLRAGERVLINGATGAVGSAALQIARAQGAHITAICSAPNHALARQLGADAVIDYRSQPVSGRYDVVMDVIGTLPWPGARAHLTEGGRLLLITADLAATLGAALHPRRDGCQIFAGTSSEAREKMDRLLGLHATGAYHPQIGFALPFAEIARAHAMAETFHKPGNIVVTMNP